MLEQHIHVLRVHEEVLDAKRDVDATPQVRHHLRHSAPKDEDEAEVAKGAGKDDEGAVRGAEGHPHIPE
jgi:hypothetical protein